MTQRQKVLITISMMVGLLIAALDQTIVATAFPKIIADLGGVSLFAWVATSYMLAATSIVPVVGKLSDIYGRKLFWMIGILIFMGGSVLSGQAQTMTQLIIFRGIQGIGGGMIMPIAQTIIGEVYTGAQRAQMQGLFAGVFALASVIGPLAGGWIVDHFHWKYIFLINLPIGAVALALSARNLRNETNTEGRRIDWMGSFLSIVAVTGFLLALQGGGEHWAWDSWQSIALFATSILSLVLFVANELRVPEPILDLKLFNNHIFTVASLISFIVGAGMFGAIMFFPWFIQGVVGASATSSGTVLLPMTLMMVVASVLGGRIARRLQYRWQIGAGLLLMSTGFLLATRFSLATTLWQARAAIMFLGFGVGLVMPILTVAVQEAFDRDRLGTVTAASGFFRGIGATVGVTVFGILFNNQMSRQFDLLLAPKLAALPGEVAAGLHALAEKPSNLIQVLLQPQLQETLPAAIRPMVIETVKVMMSDAIRPVFWAALAVTVVGVVIAQFLGRESLAARAGKTGE